MDTITSEPRAKKRSPSSILVSPMSEWVDYSGLQMLFGLRRSTVYHLVKSEEALKGASISLRRGNEKTGKRLFNVPKFRRFFESKQFTSE